MEAHESPCPLFRLGFSGGKRSPSMSMIPLLSWKACAASRTGRAIASSGRNRRMRCNQRYQRTVVLSEQVNTMHANIRAAWRWKLLVWVNPPSDIAHKLRANIPAAPLTSLFWLDSHSKWRGVSAFGCIQTARFAVWRFSLVAATLCVVRRNRDARLGCQPQR